MKYIIVFIGLLINSGAMAKATCVYENQVVEIGESIWVSDPVLVNRYTKMGQKKGWTPAEIELGIKSHDWLGYRIECRATVAVTQSGGLAGDVIKVVGANWVLNEYSGDFYDHVMKNPRAFEDSNDG